METFRERLKWIIDNRPDLSRRGLSLAGGRSDSWVGQVLRGDIASTKIDRDVSDRIAAAANVDPAWLFTGEGSPDGLPEAEDPIEGRATIVRQAPGLAADVPPEVVREAIRAFRDRRYKGQPSMADLRADFLDDLENAHELYKGIRRRLGRAEDDVLDTEPEV